MSDANTIKAALLNAPWPEYSRVTVPGATGPVELIIRRPPDNILKELLKGAKDVEGDAKDEDKADAGLGFRARVVATCVFLPDAVRALFTEEEAHGWGGLSPRLRRVHGRHQPGQGPGEGPGKLTGDPLHGLVVRIARLAGWTYEEMVRQPLSYVYALAADAMMENEAIRANTGNPSSSSAPGAPGRQRVIRYVMKPKP